MRLGDFEKKVFQLQMSHVFSLFILAENKKCKFRIKCHPGTYYLNFKIKTRIDSVCLGIWSLNLIYQFLTIAYLILLCGPNLHRLQTLEDYEKHKGNANSNHECIYQY